MNIFITLLAAVQIASASHGIDPSSIDKAANPTSDFYQHANGGWLKKTQIPSDRPGIDAFYEVNDRVEQQVRSVVDATVSSSEWEAGTVEDKIRRYYLTYSNDDAAEKLGTEPIKPLLALCNALKDTKQAPGLAARLDTLGVSALVSSQIFRDFQNSAHRMLFLGPASLGLPERDYYLSNAPSIAPIQKLYKDHIRATLLLAGKSASEATEASEAIYGFEKQLAEISPSSVQQRDVKAQFNPVLWSAFVQKHSDLDWPQYMDNQGIKKPGRVNITWPAYADGLSHVLQTTPVTTVKQYLEWCVISQYGHLLTKAFRAEEFKFSSAFSGQASPAPDWRRYLDGVQGVFGQAIGKKYVETYFPEAARDKAASMIRSLQKAFAARISQNEWMNHATRAEALKKLNHITIKVGYPNTWKSYDALEVREDSRVANAMRAVKFEHEQAVRSLNRPVDRSEWGMTPQTVNAYYNPTNNEIVFPAAILQAPFFDPEADNASNYGGIGMVIGHEMTHGFDDQGRQFDANGNLRDWWTAEDDRKFTALKKLLIDQYDQMVIHGSLKVNGSLTVGENIADLGGLHIAYDALQLTDKHFKPSTHGNAAAVNADGFTPAQRFFISFAQIWRFKASDQYIELLNRLDTHSPSSLRPAGALMNMPEFWKAFAPGSTDAAKPAKIKIW